LEDIAQYISKGSVKYAKLTLQKILNKTEKLKINSNLGRIVPEIMDKEYKEIIIGNYRIIFQKIENEVNILTIHHSARDLKRREILPLKK